MVTVRTKTFFGNLIFRDTRGRWPPPTGKVRLKSDIQFLGNWGSNFGNSTPLKNFLGGNGGGGWGLPVTDLGAKYSLKGKTFPDHPLYFLGAIEKCSKFDQIWGAVAPPITGGSRCRPLPYNGDTSPTESSWNGLAAAPRLLCL